MKAATRGNGFSRKPNCILTHALIVAGFLFVLLPAMLLAAGPDLPDGTDYPSYTPLDSWSFRDSTNWTSDNGYAPVSFTNITGQLFGDGSSLSLNTNIPARLQYNVVENDGTTNLTVDQGSVIFWFAPAWAGTNEGGTGPGQWGRLIEVGGYTPDASFGWWGLFVDDVGANLYFTVQPGDGSTTTYLTAPINWTTNYWHFIALTYSATNTALYLDGVLAANGAGITIWPGMNVLAGGFYIGSDSNGVIQAQGAFDDLYTYNVPLDSDTVNGIFNSFWPEYFLNPDNDMMANITSATSSPGYVPMYDAITGSGFLQSVGTNVNCATSTNVWMTNVVAMAAGNGTMNLTFEIQGGVDSAPYDVFATGALASPISNAQWAWMGQGYHCNIYTITNLPNTAAFIILGTPQDSDHDGLTDAYELLVSHTDPNNPDTDGDGISDSDEVLNHTDPLTPNPVIPSSLNIQTCPQ